MPMKGINGCKYSAFVSYAHDDDIAWGGWVTNFSTELQRLLHSSLRNMKHAPDVHLSGRNGPISGKLESELRERINASFAMIIVVHDHYVQSKWCLDELAYFKELFKNDGYLDRLYILALSKPAMQTIKDNREWNDLLASPNQVWQPFYRETEVTVPLNMYHEKNVRTDEFWVALKRLGDNLADKMKRSLNEPAVRNASNKILIGVVTPSLDNEVNRLVQSVTTPNALIRRLDRSELFTDFAAFGDCQTLILPFCNELPMAAYFPGGHLGLQRDAWLRHGNSLASLLWLDMRHVPANTPAGIDHLEFIAQCGDHSITARELIALLGGQGHETIDDGGDGIRIYIESNQNEKRFWRSLGEEIKNKWDEVIKNIEPALVPPLYVRPRGLPVDQLEQYPSLDDADAIVLLWGNKTSVALVDQINKVESKLSGRHVAPGIVAYLIPPHDSVKPMPAWGWTVLRFKATGEQYTDNDMEERDELYTFLRDALSRKMKRRSLHR